jgi:hypothetical protein
MRKKKEGGRATVVVGRKPSSSTLALLGAFLLTDAKDNEEHKMVKIFQGGGGNLQRELTDGTWKYWLFQDGTTVGRGSVK